MNVRRGGIWDGLVVGVIAYAAVASFYAAFDLLAARGMLFTVNLLGQAMFRGLRDPAMLQTVVTPDLTVVMLYNGVHFVASVLIGLTVVGIVAAAERRPQVAPFAFLTIVGGYVLTVVVVAYFTTAMRTLLPIWSIAVANACAAAIAGLYLLHRRPGTWARLSPFGSLTAGMRAP